MEQPVTRRRLIGSAVAASVMGAIALAFSGKPAAAKDFEVSHSPEEWKKRLGEERYYILRRQGTERAFTSPLLSEKRKGTFICAGCNLPLFASSTKYDSRTGWPSFYEALPNAVEYQRDSTFGMIRTEEHCRRCGGHLGHVFDDGPPPTGKRHCINGLSLKFKAA